jgi:hypothetical protein
VQEYDSESHIPWTFMQAFQCFAMLIGINGNANFLELQL